MLRILDYWPIWRTFRAGVCAYWDPSLDWLIIDLDKVGEIADEYSVPQRYVFDLVHLLELPHRSFIITMLREYIASIDRQICRKLFKNAHVPVNLKQIKEELIISEIVQHNLLDSVRPFQEAIALFFAEEIMSEYFKKRYSEYADKFLEIYDDFKKGAFRECLTKDNLTERTTVKDFYEDLKWLSENKGLNLNDLITINSLTSFIPGPPNLSNLFPQIPCRINPKYFARDFLDLLKEATSKITGNLLRKIGITIVSCACDPTGINLIPIRSFQEIKRKYEPSDSRVDATLEKARWKFVSAYTELDIIKMFSSTFVAECTSNSSKVFINKASCEKEEEEAWISDFTQITFKEMILKDEENGKHIKCLLCKKARCHKSCSMYPTLRRVKKISEELRKIEVSEMLKEHVTMSGLSYLQKFLEPSFGN